MSSAAEMTGHVRELCDAKNAPKQQIAWGDVARDITRLVRCLTGDDDKFISANKVMKHWRGYLRTVDADHLKAARELNARRKETEARLEAQRQANKLLVVAQRLAQVDEDMHSEDIAALERAAACVGVHSSTLADE